MIAPRWRKVLRDIWVNRVRTILIVLSIAAGVFAIGTIGATALALQTQIPAQYQTINPAHLVFSTSGFNADLVYMIRDIPGVAEAEARRNLLIRLAEGDAQENWRDMVLFGVVDFEDQRVNKVLPIAGQWPPEEGTLLIERGSMDYLGLQVGQQITIKTPQGRLRTLTISGVALDLCRMPAFMEGIVYGYITDETLHHLGQDVAYDELYVRLADDVDLNDAAAVRHLKDHIIDELEKLGVIVFTTEQPRPEGYPTDYIANTVNLLLIMLGALILILGVCLVITMMMALVAQQARQIAVIKAVGGRTRQVLGIYLGMVLILGVLSALIAIPLSVIGARALVDFVNSMLNFDARLDRFPPIIIALQIALALGATVMAALIPIWGSAHRPPAQALSEYGSGHVWSGVAVVDRLLQIIPGLTRLERLAFRNPFRNRSRLLFALLMLALAGGSFITVINLRSSLGLTVDTMLEFWRYDFGVVVSRPYSIERLESLAPDIPGVVEWESWSLEMSRRIRSDDSESNPIFLFAAPPDSRLVQPTILEGRWLRPEDENAVVVGIGLLGAEPDLGVGRDLVLKVQGEERRFTIVGVTEMIGNQTVGYLVYTTLDAYNRMAHQQNRANMIVMRTNATTPAERRELSALAEETYEDAGFQVASIFRIDDERQEIDAAFGILIALLMIMVVLLSLVGGLGLTGTMSLNVLERSREIGVIRAFGGSNRSVFRVVVLEGVAIGVMSWFLSLLLAVPLTWLFCELIGQSFLSMSLDYAYSAVGALLWLGVVVLLAAASSSFPASHAVRLTVREVLAYE